MLLLVRKIFNAVRSAISATATLVYQMWLDITAKSLGVVLWGDSAKEGQTTDSGFRLQKRWSRQNLSVCNKVTDGWQACSTPDSLYDAANARRALTTAGSTLWAVKNVQLFLAYNFRVSCRILTLLVHQWKQEWILYNVLTWCS